MELMEPSSSFYLHTTPRRWHMAQNILTGNKGSFIPVQGEMGSRGSRASSSLLSVGLGRMEVASASQAGGVSAPQFPSGHWRW